MIVDRQDPPWLEGCRVVVTVDRQAPPRPEGRRVVVISDIQDPPGPEGCSVVAEDRQGVPWSEEMKASGTCPEESDP